MTDPDPFYKLKYDNAFGNKYRYTDISGNPAADFKLGFNKSPGNTEYIIDHLTGMGFCTQIITSTVTSWGFLMLEISTRTDFGFDDWFPITKNIVNSSMPASSLVNSTSTTQGSLFYGTASNVPAYWYGETPTNSSSNAFRSTSGNISIGSKAIQGLATYMCRIHYK